MKKISLLMLLSLIQSSIYSQKTLPDAQEHPETTKVRLELEKNQHLVDAGKLVLKNILDGKTDFAFWAKNIQGLGFSHITFDMDAFLSRPENYNKQNKKAGLLIWALHGLNAQKPFKEGTYVIEDKSGKIFSFLKSSNCYRRICTHFNEILSGRESYGIDVDGLPNDHKHILFAQLHDNKLMIKPEGHGTQKISHLIEHTASLGVSLARKNRYARMLFNLDPDWADYYSKERIPESEFNWYKSVINSIEKDPTKIAAHLEKAKKHGIRYMLTSVKATLNSNNKPSISTTDELDYVNVPQQEESLRNIPEIEESFMSKNGFSAITRDECLEACEQEKNDKKNKAEAFVNHIEKHFTFPLLRKGNEVIYTTELLRSLLKNNCDN